jgi:hypothetical protein
MTAASRPPDDTPTRLSHQDEADTLLRALKHQELLDTPVAAAIGNFIEQLRAGRAEVSRLQQEHATVYTFLSRIIDVVAPSNPAAGGKTMTLCQQVDHYIVELREENALLRRSLEMLTKQMTEEFRQL